MFPYVAGQLFNCRRNSNCIVLYSVKLAGTKNCFIQALFCGCVIFFIRIMKAVLGSEHIKLLTFHHKHIQQAHLHILLIRALSTALLNQQVQLLNFHHQRLQQARYLLVLVILHRLHR